MAISIGNIVSAGGIVINAGFNQAAFIGNFLTENQLVPASGTGQTQAFSSLTAVGNYFGVNSNEYLVAGTYFKGYTGSRIKPQSILFSRYVQTPTAAYIFSNTLPSNTVTAIKALTTPTMTCNINGLAQVLTLTSALFAACTGLTDVATVIQTALASKLAGCTCSIIGNNQFCITAPNTLPAATTVAYCTGTVAELLLLQQAATPSLSQGTSGGNAAFNMSAITNNNPNWIALSYVARLTGDTDANGYAVTTDLTSWILNQSNNYVGLWWEGGDDALNPTSTTNMRACLVTAGYGVTTNGQTVYSAPIQVDYNGILTNNTANDDEIGLYSAFWAGIGASINYSAVNGKINFAGKRQDGLATNVNNNTDYQNLLAQGYNVYGGFSSRANSYQFTEQGSVGGAYLWLDNIYDAVWLASTEQDSLATLIASVGRIAYNDTGQAMVASVLTGVAESGLTNGVIETGNIFDTVQTLAVIELVGFDATPQLTASGYFIFFPPITAAGRVKRTPMQVQFLYTNGGCVNQINLGNIFVA